MTDFATAFENFVNGLKEKMNNFHDSRGDSPEFMRPVIEVKKGRRYMKITKRYSNGSLGSGACYAFIDRKNGDVLKPASYSAPAKHARSNIFKSDHGLSACNEHSVVYLR